MKKGILGTITLIYGIIVTLIPILRIFDLGVVGEKIITLFTLCGFLPGIILGIIAIVKKSNTKQAIVGMILSAFGSFIGVILRGIIQSFIK